MSEPTVTPAEVVQAAEGTAAAVEGGIAAAATDLHPAVAEVLQFFSVEHLREDLAAVARPFKELAHHLAATLKGSQLTLALHHLLSAKDSAVRAKIADTTLAAGTDSGSAQVQASSAAPEAQGPDPSTPAAS